MGVSTTICIPIGPKHTDLAQRAIRSVQGQTETVNLLWLVDEDKRGPGALRNDMLDQVLTPFVVFLDADDWIEPEFVAKTNAIYHRTGKYVYTDWWVDGNVMHAPDQAWCGDKWHCVTSLIPTQWVRDVSGFDPQLAAMEDSDFYLKLTTARHCGARLPEPLFHYGSEGTRSDDFRANHELFVTLKREITRRYANKMGCCGSLDTTQPPVGERQSDDVQAQALWRGNRTTVGRVTGRLYPRMSYPQTAWVDPRDVMQAPTMWAVAERPVTEPVPMNGLDALDMAVRANIEANVREYIPPAKTERVAGAPNVGNVLRLGRKTR